MERFFIAFNMCVKVRCVVAVMVSDHALRQAWANTCVAFRIGPSDNQSAYNVAVRGQLNKLGQFFCLVSCSPDINGSQSD